MIFFFINWISINYVKVNSALHDNNNVTTGLIKILSVAYFKPPPRGSNGFECTLFLTVIKAGNKKLKLVLFYSARQAWKMYLVISHSISSRIG